jgi:hypothetical protein
MKSNNLGADKILSRGENGGQGEGVLAAIRTESINGPCTAAESCFCELDPDISCTVGGSRCDVDEDWAFVGLVGLFISPIVTMGERLVTSAIISSDAWLLS